MRKRASSPALPKNRSERDFRTADGADQPQVLEAALSCLCRFELNEILSLHQRFAVSGSGPGSSPWNVTVLETGLRDHNMFLLEKRANEWSCEAGGRGASLPFHG